MTVDSPNKPSLALAIVGSNTTAIAAELVMEAAGYHEMLAITRRGAHTSLPIVMNGDAWAATLKRPGWFCAGKTIDSFSDEIARLTGGRSYDCLIHHSKDPFSQLLSSHPLCRRFFYIEEGFTALTGTTFGRPRKRPLQKLIWNLKSKLFYGGRINRYRNFFDTHATNYGGVYALSKSAFKDFPARIQLSSSHISMPSPLPAGLMVFLDSQYIIGNISEDAYTKALVDCLSHVIGGGTSAAVKFHPGEKDFERKSRIIRAIETIQGITSLKEIPSEYVAERMVFDENAKVVVGTSAIGLYLGSRGFQTYTFAPRLVPTSERFAKVFQQIPAEFLEVCHSA